VAFARRTPTLLCFWPPRTRRCSKHNAVERGETRTPITFPGSPCHNQGTVSNGHAVTCTVCPPGTYSSRAEGKCKKCEPGTYSLDLGAKDCKVRPAVPADSPTLHAKPAPTALI
jgi:hypothetical protein